MPVFLEILINNDVIFLLLFVNELTCLILPFRPFKSVNEIKQALARLYSVGAQNYDPNHKWWLRRICDVIIEEKWNISGVAKSLSTTLGYDTCFEDFFNIHSPFDIVDSNQTLAWDWQVTILKYTKLTN